MGCCNQSRHFVAVGNFLANVYVHSLPLLSERVDNANTLLIVKKSPPSGVFQTVYLLMELLV